jgi:hypothetical protein
MTLPRLSLAAALVAAVAMPSTALAKDVPGALGKADSGLLALAGAAAPGPGLAPNAKAAPPADATVTKRGRVLVSVTTSQPAADAIPALRQAGLDVTAATDLAPLPTVEGWLDPAATEQIATLDVVRSIRLVLPGGVDRATATAAGTDAGSVTSEGDAAHHGPQARAEFGVSGEGVRVGVISDSMDADGGLAAAQAAGDLPPDVGILADDPSGSDEGRAMAEIIYDTAPGLDEILFQTGTARTGAVGKAQAILNLAAHGADVIADDIYYIDEPMFQDGTIAQAVDLARTTGVTYFASAGNRARQSWEGTFADGGGGFNDFGGADTTQTVTTLAPGAGMLVSLQWDEAWGRAETDIDIALVDVATNTVLAVAASDNVASGLPSEVVSWGNGTSDPVTVGLQIQRYSGTRTPFMKYIAAGAIAGRRIAEHATDSDAINPDAASATGSIAVAAVDWAQPGLNVPEPFSSRGLKTRLFDAGGNRLATPEVRQKPQVAGADGVTTSVPGFAPFYGTSAATPSVAGVATLLRSYRPDFTPGEMGAAITNPANAIACLTADPSADCGSGFILADRLLASAGPTPAPPPPAPVVIPVPVPQPATTPLPTAGGPGATDTATPVTPTRPLRCARVPDLRRYTLGQALRVLDRDGCATARVTVRKHVRGKRTKHRRLRIVAQRPEAGTPIAGDEKIVLRQGWTRHGHR